MEAYRYEFADAELETLARVISDLFPEQTSFAGRTQDDSATELVVQWIAMRFGSTARRMVLTVRFTPAAYARYRAMPPRGRARSFAVLRAFVEAELGSLEERYANGETVPREATIELGDEFA
ncbi:DUF3022 domain-containing protein [Trinickia caryophylli]|uniref:DUF3022 domain-containing protein n=1 Tax=Trinickia caryophylli TaxID=28094 RepID=A0A1X7FY49_TRICW|nr:DUF3022 domain-containing protein [Trinickia caryophylli]PMS11669.1 DUF3022 domain-containing protein [Trinickia caryophylli]TRX17345.1 DUF3022 domain-containing protein [Trinickia caryophylli]WQE11916.1 DUF3022 domain-containing protein [Trinickia caryophylli]SMF60881.1 Protein of unknown function [Trinickia caryophylli]GLU34575.1 hypothetical protein Busp01_44170 [Trinickia caryophylli]